MSKQRKCRHAVCPESYVAWHEWAEKKARTHRQEKCPVCGLWEVWVLDEDGPRG